jgi:transposase
MGASRAQDALPPTERLHSVLSYKRLEQGRFRIPTIAPGTRTAMLDATELAMLLDGIDVTRVKRPALWEPPSIAR